MKTLSLFLLSSLSLASAANHFIYPTTYESPFSGGEDQRGKDIFGGEGEDSSSAATDAIKYTMGNPVLVGPTYVHLLYYGNWTEQQKETVEHFSGNVDKTEWYNIMSTYYFQANSTSPKEFVKVENGIRLGKTYTDSYSLGKRISGNAIPDLLTKYIKSGDLPDDDTAIYFFLSSADVSEQIRPDLGNAAFCRNYCGYHVSMKIEEKRYFYSFVGNPTRCLSGCSPKNQRVSPNNDVGVDALLSVFAHELVEAVSDPVSDVEELRAWQDAQGYENADKCGFKYGKTSRLTNGAEYNVEVDGRKYLIQQNWDAETQGCSTGRPF